MGPNIAPVSSQIGLNNKAASLPTSLQTGDNLGSAGRRRAAGRPPRQAGSLSGNMEQWDGPGRSPVGSVTVRETAAGQTATGTVTRLVESAESQTSCREADTSAARSAHYQLQRHTTTDRRL